MQEFIGREQELDLLNQLFKRGDATITVIKGRRRIGKSRLVEEFAKGKRFLNFSGAAPIEGITAQDERDEFCRQLAQHIKKPLQFFSDWSDVFHYFLDQLTDEPTVILFDEISWMASKDPKFIPKFKIWWDQHLSKRKNLMLVFSGTISTWVEKNIIKSKAFLGRISLRMVMEPLSLPDCAKFLKKKGFRGEAHDIYRILCITGGIPFYLEQIDPDFTAEANIKRLCFEKNGLLVSEFDMIFHDLFNGDGPSHKKIMEILANEMKTFDQIKNEFKELPVKDLKEKIDNLVICGFIRKHNQWSLKTKKETTQKLYGLSDSYIRFYLRFIEPRRGEIESKKAMRGSKINVPGFDSIIGLAMEALLIENSHLIVEELDISPADIAFSNPYTQKASPKHKGCQIDYLIQEYSYRIFACEFKFRNREIKMDIIDEMEEKLNRISFPLRTAVLPVLLHISGVKPDIVDSRYFYKIIDIENFLKHA